MIQGLLIYLGLMLGFLIIFIALVRGGGGTDD